ncbi:MAG: hypothetical protein JZU64_17470 [Rhodoferax sp.]|nr:hypothetical protein [Rhodoferax sp.]
MKKLLCVSVVLLLGLAGCGGGSDGDSAVVTPVPTDVTDVAVATLGADLVAPPLYATLESALVPDAALSVASDFPAELKPPAI